jgi:GTP-binding protein LepA
MIKKVNDQGYGSLDYEFKEYVISDLVKLDILINGILATLFLFIVHKDSAYTKGNQLVTKLRELIPRQLFKVAIQPP